MGTTLGKKNVLLVEDEIYIRDIMKTLLNEMGISRITEASNGFDALKCLDEDPDGFDLVVCDWNMPGMSGHSLFRQFKTSHPDTPFIMVTGRSDIESVRQAKELGMQSYVIKPVSFEVLERKVRHAFKAPAEASGV